MSSYVPENHWRFSSLANELANVGRLDQWNASLTDSYPIPSDGRFVPTRALEPSNEPVHLGPLPVPLPVPLPFRIP